MHGSHCCVLGLISAAVFCVAPQIVAGQDAVQILLKETATITKPIATLADVATLGGGDLGVRRHISGLDIAEIDSAPATETVQESQIELRLRLAGVDPRQYQLVGASETTITRNHHQINDQTVIEAIRDPLATIWKVDPDAIRIRLALPLTRSIQSIPAANDARLEPFVRDSLVPGRFRMSVGLYDGDDLVHTFNVSIEASIRRRVAIVQDRLSPQHVITTEDIQIEQRDLTGRDALSIPDVVINQMTSRWLRAGQIIRQTDIHRPRAGASKKVTVRRNSVVRLVARKKGLRVTLRGAILMRDSQVGDTVSVLNPDSEKNVVGRLVSPTEVEVSF